MQIYFVRHGESDDNAKKVHQGADSRLSFRGRREAEYVAKKLQLFPVDGIVSSHFARAHETAHIIAQALGKEVITNESLREVVQPSALHGKSYLDPETERVKDFIQSMSHDATWHYEDEENFFEYSQRARDFLNWVMGAGLEHPVVVSHANFMRVILGIMCFGTHFTPALYERMRLGFYVANTGIAMVEWSEERGQWRVMTWNDYAHLSEIED